MIEKFFGAWPHKGTIRRASPPEDTPGDQGWVFRVHFEDGDRADYTLDAIQEMLLPDRPAPQTRRQPEANSSHRLEETYKIAHKALVDNSLTASDELIRKVFRYRPTTAITVDSLKKKLKDAQRELRSHEGPDQPPEAQFLAKHVLAVKQHLAMAYERRTDHTVQPSAAPVLADFPAHGSAEFNEAASTALETHTQADSDPPREDALREEN